MGIEILKGNEGVQKFSQVEPRLTFECKDRREFDYKTYPSSRDDSAGWKGRLAFKCKNKRELDYKAHLSSRDKSRS